MVKNIYIWINYDWNPVLAHVGLFGLEKIHTIITKYYTSGL